MLSTKMIVTVALAAAFTFALSDQAQARNGHGGGRHRGGGHHGGGYHGGNIGGVIGGIIGSHIGGHRGHVYQPNQYQPSYRLGWGQQRYHNTTQLDYHAPQVRRHGNRFHVQPRHYDVYGSGHWH